jgi:Fe-S cluster biogenesis protein NfuA
MILGAIMEHFMSGAPLLTDADNTTAGDGEEFFDAADAETVATIKDLIETRVRPAVANDGGDITFKGFKDGVVYLNMKGSCAGCPSSTATCSTASRTCFGISSRTSLKSVRSDRALSTRARLR